jgi:hypothetical protein
MVANFNWPWRELSAVQRTAIHEFQRLCSTDRLWTRLNGKDGRTQCGVALMTSVLKLLDRFFFFSSIDHCRFDWWDDCTWGDNTLELSITKRSTVWFIEIAPLVGESFGETPWDARRLGGLLRALLTGHLHCYGCRSCPMPEHEYMQYGDGRVFQYVARAIEDIAPQLLGVSDVDMSRLSYLLSARIDNYGELSLHNLRRYGFLAETDSLHSPNQCIAG